MHRPRITDNRLLAFAVLAVFATTVLVFLPALDFGFVNLDDEAYVLNNPGIALRGQALLSWSFTTYTAYNYHPLTWLSLALDHALWGKDPFGYHLTNVLLHACNALLLVVIAYLLIRAARSRAEGGQPHRRDIFAAAAIGALFAVHPLRVESVAWVSERKDVLFAFFYVLSLIAYLRYAAGVARGRRAVPYVMSLSLFALSALSKPMAISLPLVLLLFDAYPLRRIEYFHPDRRMASLIVEKIPFVAVSAALAVMTMLAQGTSGQIRNIQELSLGERGLVAVRAIFFYLGKFVCPTDLAPFYPILRPVTFTAWDAVRVAVFLGIPVLGILLWKRSRLLLTVWLFYLVTLLPTLGIVQVGGQAAADRYSYLPLLGPLFGTVIAVSGISRKLSPAFPRLRPGLLVSLAACALTLLLTFASREQLSFWNNSIALWSREISLYPFNVSASYANRARAYADGGDHHRAIVDYSTAILMDPVDYETITGRGISYLAEDRRDEACADFRRALGLQPLYFEARKHLTRACNGRESGH